MRRHDETRLLILDKQEFMKKSIQVLTAGLFALATAIPAAQAQDVIRPYEQWESTQFVALSGHQPSDYVTIDNNWEIAYRLRTPQTADELRQSGTPCTDSQLMLLEVGGILAPRQGGKWQTVIPILDKKQTDALRAFSREVAATIYARTKDDFNALTQSINKMGYPNNAFSLVFSYLLDGRMWTRLVLFDDVQQHATWSGCYWVLYEPRTGFACGTNGYGEQDICLTYLDSRIAPDPNVMEQLADELRQSGRVANESLIAKLFPYGLLNQGGHPRFPIIKQQADDFHKLTDTLVQHISTELKSHCKDLSERFGITQEKEGMVILYHEVMWDLIDLLLRDKLISLPPVFQDAKTHKNRLNDVVFFVEGGLMQ